MPRNTSSLFAAVLRARWMLLPAIAGGLVTLAVLPPWLPGWAQAVVMEAFAPVCHQLPERSMHVSGTALAVCDRCLGIYTGAVAGAFVARMAAGVGTHASPWVVLGIGVAPAGADWLGPWLGLWTNTPSSRFLTGLWLGGAVAWMLIGAIRSASPRTR